MNFIVGKVESINKGDSFHNVSLVSENKARINVKLELVPNYELTVGKVYQFEVETYMREDVPNYRAVSIVTIEESGLGRKKIDELLSDFYDHAPIPLKEIKLGIEKYLNKINNKILRDITHDLYEKFQADYYLHPAATKFHHAYVGGLAYHTLTMLSLIDPLVDVYSYLNRDLLYSATILHDICKIREMTGVDGEYTKEGLLLGHLVMGAEEVQMSAIKLGVAETEEVLLLKHLIISHHGQLHFGAARKPQTGEALLLWFIDTIDSKFMELGEALKVIEPGSFTQSVGVLDKMRFYKPKL